MTPVPSPSRGRPRSPKADAAILRATMELLAEVGFTGMSMEEVARRAGVGKDTLYRRHKSKVELVRNTIGRLAEEEVRPPYTGSYEDDLRIYLRTIVRLLTRSEFGLVLAGLVGESARNPDLAEAFRAFWKVRRQTAREIVTPPESGRSASGANTDVIIDLVIGAIHYRLLMSGAPLNTRFINELVRVVITLRTPSKAGTGRRKG